MSFSQQQTRQKQTRFHMVRWLVHGSQSRVASEAEGAEWEEFVRTTLFRVSLLSQRRLEPMTSPAAPPPRGAHGGDRVAVQWSGARLLAATAAALKERRGREKRERERASPA